MVGFFVFFVGVAEIPRGSFAVYQFLVCVFCVFLVWGFCGCCVLYKRFIRVGPYIVCMSMDDLIRKVKCHLEFHDYEEVTDKFRVGIEFKHDQWVMGGQCKHCGKTRLISVTTGRAGSKYFESPEEARSYVEEVAESR